MNHPIGSTSRNRIINTNAAEDTTLYKEVFLQKVVHALKTKQYEIYQQVFYY